MRIRPIEPEDLDFIYTMENSPELWECSDSDAPYSRHALREYLQNLRPVAECGELRMVIETHIDATPLSAGLIELLNISPLNSRAEIGIAIHKDFRNQSLGSRALHLIENIAANRLRLHMLYAYVAESNQPAFHFFTQAGYKHTATLSDWHFKHGEYEDARLMQKIL